MKHNQGSIFSLKNFNFFVYCIAEILNLILFIISQITNERIYIYGLSFIICVCFLLTSFVIIKTKGASSISSLFWLCLFAFGISRIFFYVLGSFNFMNEQYGILGYFVWESETAYIVLNYYLLFMAIFSNSIYYSFRLKKIKWKTNKKNKEINIKSLYTPVEKNPLRVFKKVFYLAYYISVPIVTVFYLIQALTVMRLGYVSLYNGEINQSIPFAGVFAIARLIFSIAYYAILSFENRRKQFLTTSIIYIGVSAILLIQGSRAELITSMFAFLFIYCGRFGKKFKFRWLLVALIVGIPILDLVAYMRSGLALSSNFILDSYTKFFTELSGSFNIPAYYIQNEEALSHNKYPYIFEPLVKLFQYYANLDVYSGGQNLEMIKIRFNLGHQMTYHISPAYYLQGHNYASNFIAEMAEFGWIGIIVFSFVFSKLIHFIETKISTQNAYFGFMSIELCKWIFMAPRGSVFYDTYNLFKYGLIYIVIICVCNIYISTFRKRKSKKERV